MEKIFIKGTNTAPFIEAYSNNSFANISIYGYAHAASYFYAKKWFSPLFEWIEKLPIPCDIQLDFWYTYLEDEGHPKIVVEIISMLERYSLQKKGKATVNWYETTEIKTFEQGQIVKNYNGGWRIPINLINKPQPQWMNDKISKVYYNNGD